MATRTVSVDLRAKVGNYVSGMKQAEAATERVEKSTRMAKVQMAAMGVAGAAAGAYVAAQFARKIITAASDLNETINKSSVVFGRNAAAMQQWSQGAAKSFGMSQNAALGAAATYGNLFVSLGLGQDESVKMSKRLVELAGDLASFNNTDPTTALDALRSGLVGEVEPLRKFGISLQDATLKQKALDMGLIANTKGVLPPAIKAQAAYALILEQSTTAQGDFKRTSGGLANQQRILNAQWEDAQASLGQALLPTMTEAVTVLNNMLGAWNALPQPLKTVAVGVAAVTAAVVFAIPRIAAARAALAELGITSRVSGLALSGFGRFAGIATVALVGMTVAVGKINEAVAETVPSVDSLTKAVNDLATNGSGVLTSASDETVSFADALNRLADPSLTDRLNDFWGWVGSGGDAGPELIAMRKYVENIDGALANMVGSGNAEQAAKAFELLAKDAEAHGYSIDAVRGMLPQYTAALNGATTATQGVAGASATAATETRSFAESLTASNDAATATMQSQLAVADSASTLAQSMREGGASFDINTAAGAKNMANLIDLTGAISEHAAQVYTQTGSVAQATGALEVERAALINNLTATGMTTGAASALVDQFLRIPASAAGAASGLAGFANAAMRAWSAAGALLASVAGANKSSVNIGFNYKTPSVPKISAPKVAAPKTPKVSTASTFRPPSVDITDGFDPAAYGRAADRARQAVRGLAEATTNLAAARNVAANAKTPEEQAAAQRELAAAERDYADAQRESAAAAKAKEKAKPSGKNIGASFSERAAKLDRFRRNLAILAKRGLSRSIIQDLLDAGIDEGGAMAAALVKDGNIAKLNATQAAINKDQRALEYAYGGGAAGVGGVGGSGSSGTTGSASASVVLSFENASKPIIMKVEGEQVWKALLKVKRSRGGAALGLA